MAVQSRTLHIPAGLPLDESTRPELLPVGTANVQNKNVRSIERGTLEKRLGFASQPVLRSDGTSRTAGRKVLDHRGRLCVYDGDVLDEYSDTLAASVIRNKVPEAHFRLRDLPSASLDARVADLVYCNGLLVVLQMRQTGPSSTGWEYSTCIVEAATGTVVRSLEIVAGPGTLSGVGLATFGTKVVLGVGNGALAQIKFSIIDLSNAAGIAAGWSTLTTISEPGTTGQLSMSSGTDRVYAAFDNGVNRVKVRALDATGVIQNKDITTIAAPDTNTICLSESGDVLWVGWNDSGGGAPGVNVIALNLTSITTIVGTQAVVFTATTEFINSLFIVATTPQHASIAINDSTESVQMHVRALRINAGACTSDSTYIAVANAEMTSRPFYRNGRVYGWFSSTNGDSCVLADWTITSSTVWLRPVVAPVTRGLVDHPANRTNNSARTAVVSNTEMFFAFGVKRTGLSSGALGVVLDFADREIGNSATHHGVTYIAAGVTSVYDGDVVAEAGFLVAPAAPSSDTSTAGAVTLTSGGRNYVAIYSWTDAVGNVHLSGVSPTSGLTGNVTSKKIVNSINGIALAVERPIDILLYGTVDGGEPPYYFIGSTSNDPKDLVTIDDNFDDATLSTRAKLYAPNLPGAAGEAQDRRAPSGLRNLVSYNGMLVGTVANAIVFSGQEVSGEGTWFSPIFEVPYGADDFTGLRSQDGYLAAFTARSVLTVAGESPSDNGASGGMGTPRLVCADYGCVDANSLVSTSLGVFFQSDRGIEVFTRSQSVEWIGEPILDTLAAYPYVMSAVVDGRNSIVRFTLAQSIEPSGDITAPNLEDPEDTSGGGVDLIFDLSMKSWISVDVRADRSGGQHAATLRRSGEEATYAVLTSDGVVHLERSHGDARECRDDTTFVEAQYTISPVTFGLQQEQRVFEAEFTFEKHSPADLVIEVAEDYGAFGATTADKEWDSAVTDGIDMVPFRTKSHGHAMQLRLRDRDVGGDDSGRGYTFIGLSSDAAPKTGATRGTTRGNTELRR